MTKKRQLVLDSIISQGPLNAHQLEHYLGDALDKATVYRALKYLEDEHFIKSFVFDCDERGVERYYCKHHEGHKHYMHCERCHGFIQIDSCPVVHGLSDMEKLYGFKVTDHAFTLKGVCSDCQ